MTHTYSTFWPAYAAGLISLSPLFAERDAWAVREAHQAEALDEESWLRLPEPERNRVVAAYTGGYRPREVYAWRTHEEQVAATRLWRAARRLQAATGRRGAR